MALLAEHLIDEWLNRQGFFTMRGIKDGVDEIDLLGVRQTVNGLEGWHVEAQVSFRPVGYITKLTRERARILDKDRTSAWERPPDILHESVIAWFAQKFSAKDKQATREHAWPGIRWSFYFVHGVVRSEAELNEIAKNQVTVIPFYKVLADVCARNADHLTGAAGTDLADIVHYYQTHRS
jgi:hypothetical protein